MHTSILAWYAANARDLPWRRPGVSPYAVLVSEVMLQQTPVSRVLGPWQEWLDRWPTPADLAEAPTADVLRVWGRLGYPRRALRLQQAAAAVCEQHGGELPTTYAELKALPGIGDYTAAAIVAFAHRYGGDERPGVLDTNVRRVFARLLDGVEFPTNHITSAERARATELLPEDPETAATWSVAVMELGALVCTARSPACDRCPVADLCAWRQADYPAYDGPPRRGQAWEGTDRQCRGRIMAALRDADQPVTRDKLDLIWPHTPQLEKCLETLVGDGLAVSPSPDRYALPS